MTTWTEDAYLKEKYGELTIHVVMKKEIRHLGPRKMLLRKFLREYEYENWHLTTSIPQPLMHELTIPVCLRCGLRKYLLESELWMSSGGTASTLHAHADHLLHCLLAGRKDFVIIHPQYKDELAFVQKTSHAGAGFSEIDTDRVNMFQHKGVAKVPWTYATLKPGDCIYIPAEHLHQVRSYGRSISWTMLWAPAPNADFTDCDKMDLNRTVTLDDVHMVWTYVGGDRRLSNTQLNGDSLKHLFQLLMRDESILSYEQFRELFDEIMSELQVADRPSLEEAWELMDTEKTGHITKQQLTSIEPAVLHRVAVTLNPPHSHDEL